MKHLFKFGSLSIVIFMILINISKSIVAKEKISSRGPVRLAKTSVLSDKFFEANRIRSTITNEGELVSARSNGGNPAMFWPKTTDKTINYQSGLWIAGKVDGIIRTAAAEFTSEFVAGTLENWRDAALDAHFRTYEINVDEVRKENFGTDYLEWPFEEGAPFMMTDSGHIEGAGHPYRIDMDTGDTIVIDRDDYANMIPGLIGDQTLWSVFNDRERTRHASLFGTNPIGVEVHQTVWGYNRADAFGDMMFMKYLIIKDSSSTDTLKDAYLSFWADVDLGNSNDDLVALVLEESFGYHYNDGTDQVYGDNPPAIGYDFFQGPYVFVPCATDEDQATCRQNGGSFFDTDGDGIFNADLGDIAADTAKVSRQFRSSGRIIGATNLEMSSFAHYVRGGDPWERDPETGIEVYNYMQGFDALGNTKLDDDGNPTLFSYTGDPVTGEGWLRDAGADMRFLMTAGPFTIAPGDTQELVGGIIIAQGASRLDAVTQVKAADLSAQIAYDIDFALPPPPPPPIVTVGSVENGIILTWEPNAETYDQPDPTVRDSLAIPIRYKFQGYNIYQYNGPTIAEGFQSKLLATFDIIDGVTEIFGQLTVNGTDVEVIVQTGLDNGIQRTLFLTEDAIRGGDLVNFRKYYYVVESYGYHELGSPRYYPSPPLITTAIPGPPVAGTVLVYDAGDIISTFERFGSTPNEGIADIDLNVTIIDPHQTADKSYEISFFTDSSNSDYWWKMTDLSTNSVAIDSQGAKTDLKGLVDSLLINPAQINIYDGLSVSLNGTYLSAVDHDGSRSIQTENINPNTVMNFIGTIRTVNTKERGLLRDLVTRLPVMGGVEPLIFRRDIEIRITSSGSKATVYSSIGIDLIVGLLRETSTPELTDVSYEVWDIEYVDGDGTIGRQINSILIDDEADDDVINGFLGATNGDRDIIIPIYSAYDGLLHEATDTMAAWGLYFLQDDSILVVSATFDSTYISAGASIDDVYQINFINHILVDEDVLTFTTKAPETGNEDAINSEINKINVFPNPYFGQNIEEINAFNRFVTFTHLPPTDVTIRVFTLAGHLVSVINHSNGTSMEQWNLNNNDGIPVASGMYIAHIETSTGKSKILKFAVMIPEERIGLF